MPIAMTERPYRPVRTDPPHKRWTRAECAALEATGLGDQQRLELVEGELFNKLGKNRPPVKACLRRVSGWQNANAEAPSDVASQDNPTNEPVPDLIVLGRPSQEFPEKNPQPTGFDLKTELHARAGIPDDGVFDIQARRLIVHRDPQNGLYQLVTVYRSEEVVAPLVAPEYEFRVGDAFPG
jgi:hypothetical protein